MESDALCLFGSEAVSCTFNLGSIFIKAAYFFLMLIFSSP